MLSGGSGTAHPCRWGWVEWGAQLVGRPELSVLVCTNPSYFSFAAAAGATTRTTTCLATSKSAAHPATATGTTPPIAPTPGTTDLPRHMFERLQLFDFPVLQFRWRVRRWRSRLRPFVNPVWFGLHRLRATTAIYCSYLSIRATHASTGTTAPSFSTTASTTVRSSITYVASSNSVTPSTTGISFA